MTRALFDPLVEAYDLARPGYPDRLYNALEAAAGPLAGAAVVEVAAGTGLATRGLSARGARLIAVDVAPAMLGRLRRHLPGVPALVADAHALPVRTGRADLVCYAQAWHWVRVPEAAAEAARVLRPGGALALWWNDVAAEGAGWWEAQQARIEAGNAAYSRDYRARDYAGELIVTGRFEVVRRVAEIGWQRPLDLDTYLTWLRSKSYVAALGAALPEFLSAERASLTAAFPNGRVVEPFRTTLYVARRGR